MAYKATLEEGYSRIHAVFFVQSHKEKEPGELPNHSLPTSIMADMIENSQLADLWDSASWERNGDSADWEWDLAVFVYNCSIVHSSSGSLWHLKKTT